MRIVLGRDDSRLDGGGAVGYLRRSFTRASVGVPAEEWCSRIAGLYPGSVVGGEVLSRCSLRGTDCLRGGRRYCLLGCAGFSSLCGGGYCRSCLKWSADAVYEVALKFVLCDSRVHVANVGMRWPEEVDRNVALVEQFRPPTDMADLPRLTAGIYHIEDQQVGAAPT